MSLAEAAGNVVVAAVTVGRGTDSEATVCSHSTGFYRAAGLAGA